MQKIPLMMLFLCLSCNRGNDTVKPRVDSLTESVYASGSVTAEKQYTVYSPVNGTIEQLFVVAGQKVSAGQSLFTLKSEKARLAVENSELAYRASAESSRLIQDKITEMEIRVQAAAEKSNSDCALYDRYKKAQQYGGITDAEVDRAASACESSRLSFEASRRQLSQLKEQLTNERERNRISLMADREAQGDHTIRSAIDGIAYDIMVHQGLVITPQVPLAVIGAKEAFLVELQVDENDMASIRPGQRVLITLDSYKNSVFEARVSKIYPIMDEHSRTFKIEAVFKAPPPRLYPNLSAEANIIIRTKKDALIIPKEYLLEGTYVLVNKNEKRKIQVGLSDYRHVEVLSGLHANENIYKP